MQRKITQIGWAGGSHRLDDVLLRTCVQTAVRPYKLEPNGFVFVFFYGEREKEIRQTLTHTPAAKLMLKRKSKPRSSRMCEISNGTGALGPLKMIQT